MFKSENVGVAWAGSALKTFKTIKSIKIVKQHAPKSLLRGIKVSGFLLLNDKKMKRGGLEGRIGRVEVV